MDLLYCDSARIIIAKPTGRSSEEVSRELSGRFGGEMHPVHRIDQPVSGPLLLARTSAEAARLSRDLQSGTLQRTYIAVCERPGGPVPEGLWEDSITWDRRRNRALPSPEGKRAILTARCIGKTDRYDVWSFLLGTGRHHQIRVQCALRGIPIAGDLKYGARRSRRGGGIYLHGYSLTIYIPGELTVFCGPPQDPLWIAAMEIHSSSVIPGG